MQRRGRASLRLACTAVVVVAAACNLGTSRRPIDVPAVAIASGDLNGDGIPDLATAGGETLAVHLSDGAGAADSTTYVNDDPTGSSYYSGVEVLDGDSDGDLDVVGVHHYERTGGANITLWPNDGTGALGTAVPFGWGAYVRGMATGDVDGDGRDDLAAIDEYATQVSSGNGTDPSTRITLPDSAGWAVEMADVDGDGLEDVLAGGRNLSLPNGPAPSVSVFLATGTGFASPVVYATGSDLPLVDSLRVADMDGDGVVDVLVGSTSALQPPSQAIVTVLPGLGDGTFGPAQVDDEIPITTATDIEVADIDTDGALDAVVSGTRVLFGDGAGGFADDHVLALSPGGDGYPVVRGPDAVAVDLDGDEVTDLATAGARVDIFLNRLDGARDHG